jgi:hypothetical protein
MLELCHDSYHGRTSTNVTLTTNVQQKYGLFGEDEHIFKNQELRQDLNSGKPLKLFELACFF